MKFDLTARHVKQMEEWAVKAGRIALEYQLQVVETLREDETPVTEADHVVEDYLVDQIREAFPDHRIVTEEAGLLGPESDWVWALDPIDGTKSFARRLPVWGISIGLLHRGEPAAGVIYLPTTRDLFCGGPGGARWNGCMLAPMTGWEDDSNMFLAVHSHAHEDNQLLYPRIQAFGATAAHLAFVASGRAVGALARRVHIWDLAGGLAILRQVGGKAEYVSGRPLRLDELMDGRKTPEQVLTAASGWLERLHLQVRPMEK